ncbi:MAG: hypothetical protein HY548_09350 [Elusimicrobia bacterium]|nr:hypothetical protein [Elusimicrobiota bacterium]
MKNNPQRDRYSLVGKKIVDVRPMSYEEMQEEGWDTPTTVIVLDDGCKLFASRDEEGNGAGRLFGIRPDGKSFLMLA